MTRRSLRGEAEGPYGHGDEDVLPGEGACSGGFLALKLGQGLPLGRERFGAVGRERWRLIARRAEYGHEGHYDHIVLARHLVEYLSGRIAQIEPDFFSRFAEHGLPDGMARFHEAGHEGPLFLLRLNAPLFHENMDFSPGAAPEDDSDGHRIGRDPGLVVTRLSPCLPPAWRWRIVGLLGLVVQAEKWLSTPRGWVDNARLFRVDDDTAAGGAMLRDPIIADDDRWFSHLAHWYLRFERAKGAINQKPAQGRLLRG